MVHSIIESLLNSMGYGYYYYDFWEEDADPRMRDFPIFCGGPWTLLGIVSAYLLFVNWLGPALMKGRQPFVLRGPIMVYNFIMIFVNGWIFFEGMYLLNFGLDTWGCQPKDPGVKNPELTTPKSWRLVHLAYVFFLIKLVEFLDTIFFVLRKKYNQVTRLHVIHHSLVPVVCWIAGKFFSVYASTSIGFFPLINSGIHMIMYTYYLLSALGPWIHPYLWWKKYLTQMQMYQFVAIFIHSSHFMFIPNCEVLPIFQYMGIFNAILFIVLFSNFYIRSYILKRNTQAKINSAAAANGPVSKKLQ